MRGSRAAGMAIKYRPRHHNDLYANVATNIVYASIGKLFDRRLQKGIVSLPPCMILSFLSNASYKEVIQKGVEKFFHIALTHGVT